MPHDLRYAVRQLRKSPSFTVAAIFTLALGIGANTSIYQLLDTLLFRTLPVHDPARLVRVVLLDDGKPVDFSYPAYRELAARQQVAEGLLATSDSPLHAAILHGRGQARTVNTVLVTANYFRVLGVGAATGRVFTEADDVAPVVVISDAFRQREFGRNSDAIGQNLRINKSVVTVIGIAPPEFTGEKPGNAPDVWAPMGLARELLATDWLNAPKGSWLTVLARLRPGVSQSAARQALDAAYRQAVDRSHEIRVESAARGTAGLQARFESPVLILMAAVGLVLLIACCNLATLLLGRAAARSHEIAVRMALGAGRGRIVRQLLAESLVLSTIGAAAGLALSPWIAVALMKQAAGMAILEWNWRVLAFTAAVTALATILSGLAPALSATRISRYPGPRRRWLTRTLIVAQVSLSLLLLSGAGLLTRSLWNLRHQDFGFRPARMLLVDLPWEFSPTMMARYAALRDPLFARMNALPGVQSAAICGFGPLGLAEHTGPLVAAGQLSRNSRIVHVSARYFETTGIPIVAGRGLSAEDRDGAPKVVVLSETAARLLFGTANPVGRFVSQEKSFDASRALEVVGVARDVRFNHPADPFGAIVYVPMAQSPAPITSIAVRAVGDPALLAREVRATLHEIDPDLAIGSVRTAPDAIDALLGRERIVTWVAGGFGVLALALTCVGVYGVIAYAVERRTREVGIRLALGARRGQVTALLIRELAFAIATSVILGGAGALAVGRSLRTLLFGIPPDDYAMLIWPAVLLIVVASVAAYVPARRAGRLDPTVALRQE